MASKHISEYSVRQIWGLAKCAELNLTDEELHILVECHTGKKSIRQLTQNERYLMVEALRNLKASVKGEKRRSYNREPTGTTKQLKKIRALGHVLGWETDKKLNGMSKRLFGVASIEWLDYPQCSKLIEALKAMKERQMQKDGIV